MELNAEQLEYMESYATAVRMMTRHTDLSLASQSREKARLVLFAAAFRRYLEIVPREIRRNLQRNEDLETHDVYCSTLISITESAEERRKYSTRLLRHEIDD
jgi:hypothetical protein